MMHATGAVLGAVVVLLVAPRGGSASDLPRSVPLRTLQGSTLPHQGWAPRVCDLLGVTCSVDHDAPSLHHATNAPPGTYYAILPGPVLAQLTHGRASGWRLLRRWTFSAPAETEERIQVRLHPALYPAAPGRWAVALRSSRTEGYAGGGASYTRADILLLPEQGGVVGPENRILAAVPFSCARMVRACFSARDYRTSPHCHDEWQGGLTLRFVPGRQPPWYDWVIRWRETHWRAGVPRSRSRTTSVTATLRRGDDAATVAARTQGFGFCEEAE